ncbi:ABC transporter substrate-binding protein [Arenibacterium sp. CAU 1754]
MQKLAKLIFVLTAIVWQTTSVLAEEPTLRLSVLKFGTVNWELDTISHYGLDRKHGFKMVVDGVAGSSASQVAFQGGQADVMVTDWIWVARQRAAGKDFVLLPYSKAVGGLMVKADSGISGLPGLAGKKIGIAGGPLDKSWLILRAYAAQQGGIDLAKQTEQVFAAPPLVYKAALDGQVAGAINFWHFAARMEAAGMVELVDVAEAARALGLDPELPLLGFVFQGAFLRDNPDVVRGFARASREAKEILASDDAAWERLRPRMKVKNDNEFKALRDGFRAGIPARSGVDLTNAARFLEVMSDLGGRELIGAATSLPEGVFIDLGD